jgi:hypothetical protein
MCQLFHPPPIPAIGSVSLTTRCCYFATAFVVLTQRRNRNGPLLVGLLSLFRPVVVHKNVDPVFFSATCSFLALVVTTTTPTSAVESVFRNVESESSLLLLLPLTVVSECGSLVHASSSLPTARLFRVDDCVGDDDESEKQSTPVLLLVISAMTTR